ncbi:hypothetical protein BHE74_00033904, partial [Ensete ventricosum]
PSVQNWLDLEMVDHLGTRGPLLSAHLSRIIMEFPPGVTSLEDLFKFYYPLALVGKGPRGAPRSVRRLFGDRLP